MSFHFISGNRERGLELFFEAPIEERLVHLIQQETSAIPGVEFRGDLAQLIVEAITGALETRLLPPSERQLKYAIQIAREFSLELPPEVLLYRDRMTGFLTRHADAYRRRRSRGEGLSEVRSLTLASSDTRDGTPG